ncbi:DUF2169 family type VI secretion system accessory protein [Algicola sagamiensis]|uniref:DUF2169 family type VI secretion system accessory protein n=1 Tax=Algicola sagamiensis TaxID=163869 RepID=UPI0003613B18|nr:DUF2169 domain-containing protein [Algicola sagamiensis]
MQLIKPRCLGLIHKTYGLGEQQMAIGALCFFSLEQPRHLLMENVQWPYIIKALGTTQVLDMGFAKPYGEALVAGAICAKEGEPVERCTAQLHFGDIQKSVIAIGDRIWQRGWWPKVSEPIPFAQLPISYVKAYGGPDFAANPIGVGSKKSPMLGENQWSLPNFYYPEDSLNPKKLPKRAAGFGPLEILWPQRAQYQGTYDEHWLKSVHPGFPLDTDPRLFMCSPDDQWCASYFLPNSPYTLEGFHPKHQVIQGELPNVRIRMVIQQEVDDQLFYREAKTHIDTVWFFPEYMMGVAIHRAVIPVQDVDGLDIKQLLLACEGADDLPRPREHYEAQLRERTDRTSAVNSLLNEAPLLPEKTPEQVCRRDQLIQKAKLEFVQRKSQMMEKLQADYPELVMKAEEDPELDDLAAIPTELLNAFDYDLKPVMDKANQLVEEARQVQQEKLSEAEKIQALPQEPESFERLKRRVFQPIMVDLTGAENTSDGHSLEITQGILSQSQRRARQIAPECTLAILPLPLQQQQQIRQWVIELLETGQSLSGRDLAGGDLHGLDFSGQDLSHTMFEGANLKNCQFKRCQMRGSVLTGATIDLADFSAAHFDQANFGAVTGGHVNFQHTQWKQSQLIQAHLIAPDFSEAKLSCVNATKAKLSQANVRRASIQDSQFVQCQMQYADLQSANLDACVLFEANLMHSHWQNASVHRCLLLSANLEQSIWHNANCHLVQLGPKGSWQSADLSQSKWRTCGFRDLQLQGCDAIEAIFVECDFTHVNWSDAALQKSTFQRCLMMGAKLGFLNWQHSLLYETNLRKVQAQRVDWQHCRFQSVDIDHGEFEDCLTEGLVHTPVPKQSMDQKGAKS